ncbi:hypothetical protein F4801DRAFT_597093 [Xylaria longipes]|nr:hypothetical protein F4801DRAFT_597093 [Xylaria longipes]RYC59591.1 hypothetical protein CHU98_g6633 [Xylaria longipes]
MSAADKASRLTVTTRTNGTEYYDQVLAMSSHVVNDGWAKLHEVSPDLQKIDLEDLDVGSLHAKLLPCRIAFDGTNHAGVKVFYQLRFESGRLENPSKSLSQDLAGWVLTVSVAIDQQQQREMTPAQLQYIKDNFSVPGDYSIARLYADLTDAAWDHFVTDRSAFGADSSGNPITWTQWCNQNPSLRIKLTAFLEAWVEGVSAKGLTTLGVKVVLPSTQSQNPLDPTFPPTAMMHQGFQYQNSATSIEIARDFDSILYCEQLMGRSLPSASFIADGGNWCYPESGSNPAVYGTFAISWQIFFQRQNGLLEHIRPFSRLSEITLENVSISSAGMNHIFHVGYNQDHQDANDNYFLPTSDEPNHQYIWKKQSQKQNGTTVDGGMYYYCTQQSDQQVTVVWQPGSNTITLAGKTTYSYASQFWSDITRTSLTGDLEESYTATWNVSIVITTDNDGHLTLTLGQQPSEVTVAITKDYSRESNIDSRQNTIEGYMGDIQTALQSQLVIVERNLAKIFATTGQWVYPGNGTLYFRNPMFNNYGDVLAEVEYKSLPSAVNVPAPNGPSTLTPYPSAVPNAKQFSTTI